MRNLKDRMYSAYFNAAKADYNIANDPSGASIHLTEKDFDSFRQWYWSQIVLDESKPINLAGIKVVQGLHENGIQIVYQKTYTYE